MVRLLGLRLPYFRVFELPAKMGHIQMGLPFASRRSSCERTNKLANAIAPIFWRFDASRQAGIGTYKGYIVAPDFRRPELLGISRGMRSASP